MSLFAKKTIGPTDVLRYIVDYADWLDNQETIATDSVTVSVDTVDGGPATPVPVATITSISVSPDGQSLVFYVNGNNSPVASIFAVNLQITSVVAGSPPGQTKSDHIEFVVVAS